MPTLTAVSSTRPVDCDWLIVPVLEDAEIDGGYGVVGEWLQPRLKRLREAGDLTGKPLELLDLRDLSDVPARRVLLTGLGKAGTVSLSGLEKSLTAAIRRISSKKVDHAALLLSEKCVAPAPLAQAAKIAALSTVVGSVGQGLYKSEPDRFPIQRMSIVAPASADVSAIQSAVEEGRILGEATNLTRELVNRPPEDVYPEVFADRAAQLAAEYGLECEEFDEARLREERMGAMLAVARGSDRPPRMVVVRRRGAADADAPWLALVGKGVTFDSGGLSLKPSDGMKTMKCDMAGAATVLGAMVAAARLKLPVNLIGLMGLVENMPSGRAYKLGDVLRARNGVTIEVHNTDAEGRLVLADVLSYAVDLGVSRIVDLATLTGSCVVALGEDVAGAFANDQPWCDAVLAAARRAGEDVWQLPMFDSYAEQLKSDVADLKNIGSRWGGSITAAKFLERFVAQTPWVHLDIAGPAFAESNKPHREGGASGAYVRTLVEAAKAFP
ncbi:MAG: leucyl aminopeptidase [Planctomyces sp.]|nr:leucyl aminopeptidase [Planctomyces sp.]